MYLSRIYPYGQVSRQIFDNVRHGVSGFPGCSVEHRVCRISDLEASKGWTFKGLVRVPVIGELVPQGGLQLLSKQVDPSPGQLVIEEVEDKVLRHFDLNMHV